MATARKSSSAPKRKPATKRTPRKTAPKKRAANAPDRETIKEVIERAVPSEEERQAKLTAYTTLKSAGVPVPPELASEVEVWIAEENRRREQEAAVAAERQAKVDEENAKGPFFVRNGYRAEFNLRLDRQTEKRRIQLKPRGMPGDLYPLEADDLNDVNLRRNLDLGVIEIVPAGEARRIMDQQTHNAGRRVHPVHAMLRNSTGQPYEEGSVKVEAEFNSQGVTVGYLDPAQQQGHVEDKRVQVQRAIPGQPAPQAQVPEVHSQFIPTGGNPAIIQQGPIPSADKNVQAKIADDIARRRGVQGRPEDVMGLNVVVEPVKHE